MTGSTCVNLGDMGALPDLITRQQAAALLGLSVGRVRQLYDSGRLTKYRNAVGNLRLSRDEVIALKLARETFRPADKVSA